MHLKLYVCSFDILTPNFVSFSEHTNYTTSIWCQRHLLVKSNKPLCHITSDSINEFSNILLKIISKCIYLLSFLFGLMLANLKLCPSFYLCCAWTLNCYLWLYFIIIITSTQTCSANGPQIQS